MILPGGCGHYSKNRAQLPEPEAGLALSPPANVMIAGFIGKVAGCILQYRNKREGRNVMDLYIIRRRGTWANEEELEAASAKSVRVGEEMANRVRWIRSYAVTEPDGRIGSVCVYEASDPEAIREHGRRVGAPSEDFQIVRGTVVKNPDPHAGADSA
jgi:hypothetical protein